MRHETPVSAPRSRPRRHVPLALLALGVLAAACADGGPVTIGGVVPRSGPASVYGTSIERGMTLAMDELQEAHAKGEYPVALALELRDSASSPERASAALEELFAAGASVAVGGVTADEAAALAAVADREERVLVSPTGRSPSSAAAGEESGSAETGAARAGSPSRYVFHLFPSRDREGNKLASFAALELRLARSAVVAPAGDGAAADSFAQEFERNRGRVVTRVGYRDPSSEAEGIVRQVLASRPQAVLVAGPGEPVATLVTALQSRGFRGAVLTTSEFAAPELVESAGRHAEGVLLARPMFDADSSRPAVRRFVAAYTERHGEQPDLWAAYGYDAVRVLAAALEKAGTPREAWSGMRSLQDYEGVTGHIQFDEAGDVSAFPRVYVISRGEMKELAELEDRHRREIYRRVALAIAQAPGARPG